MSEQRIDGERAYPMIAVADRYLLFAWRTYRRGGGGFYDLVGSMSTHDAGPKRLLALAAATERNGDGYDRAQVVDLETMTVVHRYETAHRAWLVHREPDRTWFECVGQQTWLEVVS